MLVLIFRCGPAVWRKSLSDAHLVHLYSPFMVLKQDEGTEAGMLSVAPWNSADQCRSSLIKAILVVHNEVSPATFTCPSKGCSNGVSRTTDCMVNIPLQASGKGRNWRMKAFAAPHLCLPHKTKTNWGQSGGEHVGQLHKSRVTYFPSKHRRSRVHGATKHRDHVENKSVISFERHNTFLRSFMLIIFVHSSISQAKHVSSHLPPSLTIVQFPFFQLFFQYFKSQAKRRILPCFFLQR